MSKYKTLKKSTKTNIWCYGFVAVAFALIFTLQKTGLLKDQISGLMVTLCAYIVMAISLNLVVGISGELSLGHAGFMSIGAFTAAIINRVIQYNVSNNPELTEAMASSESTKLFVHIGMLAAAIVGAAIVAAIAGFVIGIPVLRLRGDYLAIVTLAFGEIIKNLINCLYVGIDANGLHFSMKDTSSLNMQSGKIILNGPQGATGIEKVATFTSGAVLIVITLFIVLNLINSRTGRAVTAIRDNRIAAESVGIGVTKYKMIAFVTSAALAGTAGALYAQGQGTIKADKFDFNTSILVLVFVVLGGLGNIFGSMIATSVLYILPELLRAFSTYRMLIYAIVLILVMLATNNETFKLYLSYVFDGIKGFFGRKKSQKPEGGDDNG